MDRYKIDYNMTEEQDFTPALRTAIAQNDPEAVRILLEVQGDILLLEQRTMLMFACRIKDVGREVL